MRLLERPSVSVETVKLGGTYYEERNFFSLLPFQAKKRLVEVRRPEYNFAGRTIIEPILVEMTDEEHERAVSDQTRVLEFGVFQSIKRDVFIDGFVFKGMFPLQNIGTHQWKCSIDYFEEVMSHKQHYRYKNFPANVVRQQYTTVEEFLSVIAAPQVEHVVVDQLTYNCLTQDFEAFQDRAYIATTDEQSVGLILVIDGTKMIFTDAMLPENRRWVNEGRGDSARPQFIAVDPPLIEPFAFNA